MKCEQFQEVIEQQDAGELPNPAFSHLQDCEACRSLFADFDAIRAMALELDADVAAPPERVWISLCNQLEAEGLIHESQIAPPGASVAGSGWWANFQRPAIAGAFLVLVIAAAGTFSYFSNSAQT